MTTVTTQSELDAALKANDLDIVIASPGGVWLSVGSATVSASGSATVSASGSATVSAYDSATVSAYGSATVRAYGSATVSASGSATVRAYDSATVRAYDSATVSAYDSATVRAGKHVAVHLHSKRVKHSGGVVIDVTDIDLSTPDAWVDNYGLKVSRGRVTVYKGVDANLTSAHGTVYPIGKTVKAPDWKPTQDCGNGLHFSPSPTHTESYCTPVRYLECTVALADIIPLGDKIKAPSCRVVREVDAFGRAVTA